MTAATLTVGHTSQRLDLYPAEPAVITDRVLTNKLLDLWDDCINLHQATLKAIKRVNRLIAKIEASDLAWNHPHRIEANLALADRTEEWERSFIDYKHALDRFVGVIQCWTHDDRLQAAKAILFGSRTDDRSLTLLESVYREPDLVEGQHLWPEMMEVYELNLPDHMRIDHWRVNREIAERQQADQIAAGKQIAESEWRGMFRQMVRRQGQLDQVPF